MKFIFTVHHTIFCARHKTEAPIQSPQWCRLIKLNIFFLLWCHERSIHDCCMRNTKLKENMERIVCGERVSEYDRKDQQIELSRKNKAKKNKPWIELKCAGPDSKSNQHSQWNAQRERIEIELKLNWIKLQYLFSWHQPTSRKISEYCCVRNVRLWMM